MGRADLTRARSAGLAAALAVAACGGDGAGPPAQADGDQPPDSVASVPTRTYERGLVFAAVDGDSVFLVPWLMRTVTTPDSVLRSASGWLARGGIWEAFYDERWTTPPTRSPARFVPYGNVSFVVREGGAVDGILFEEGQRSLEIVMGSVTANWVGPRGEAVEVLEGSAYLSDQRVGGVVLDIARASAAGSPPGGDWAILLSGDSLRMVLAADVEHGGAREPVYRGWAETGNASLQWPAVQVDWWETQAFPPARRDVPVAWRIWSADGLVEGELRAVSAEIEAGSGPGPLLPVRALLEIAGDVSTVEGNFEVHGLLVHERR